MSIKNNKKNTLFHFCNISKYFIINCLALVSMECLSTIGLTYFQSKAIDLFTYKTFNRRNVLIIIIGMIIFVILQWIWSIIVPYKFKKNGIYKIAKIRKKIYESIINTSTTNVKKINSGDITMKLSVEINKIQNFLSNDLYLVSKRFLMALGALLLSLFFNWKLAILEFLILPFIIKKNRETDESMDENFYLIYKYYGQMGDLFTSILNSLKLIKTFCVETLFEKKITNLLNNIQNESIINNKKIVKSMNKLVCINLLPTVIHFTIGTLFVLCNWISLGEFVAFAVLRGHVTNFLMYIVSFIPTYKSVKASIRRMEDVTKLKESHDDIHSTVLDEGFFLQGSNICFSYDKQKVLENLNISIYSDSINLLVGESGSGKTTLLNILSSIMTPDSGYVIYNSKIVKGIEIQNSLAYVSQSPFILSGSIMENINFFGKSTSEEIIDICRKLNIHKAIMQLPNHYETMIGGEHGNVLSGGQLQRLCLARAFVSEAKIIFLDEPSSALDTENEMEVIQLLKKLKRDKTVVISTHSAAFINEADYVYLVEGGKVARISNVGQFLNGLN